ncbi:MAG: IS200/IS605 family transposase [Bacteroidales bacterium]|nr:IS200/IS605 family transposase [Bacteroidales bacterium]
MSKTKSLHHIVIATKHREMTITEGHKNSLYAYIIGILKNKNCFVLSINGIPNHIHLLVDLNPTIALADLVKELKVSSHYWLKNNPNFRYFYSWNRGYYAVSIGADGVSGCSEYIMNQERHHRGCDLISEMEEFALRNGLAWYEDDWQ